MKVFVACLFTGIFVVACTHTFAQNSTAIIKGKVSIEKNVAADLATVILLSAKDSSILKSVTCNDAGVFDFQAIDPGKYLLLTTKIGYTQLISGPYNVTGTVNVNISLTKAYPQLKEVSIAAQKEYIEVKPDRIVLNVQSSILATGNSALDILKQAPSVHVDNQGNISLIGHQTALVTIDGKPTNLRAEDLVGFLQGMQSTGIQRIELITNPSSKYEAAAGGIINIVSKKGTGLGTNVTLSAGGGYGAFGKANTSLVFNSRTDKLNVFGSYAYSADESYHSILTDRVINYNGLNNDYYSDYYARQQHYSNTFRIGADYFISDKQTIGFLMNGVINSAHFQKDNSLKVSNNGVLDSVIRTSSKPMRYFNDIDYDLNYNNVLDKSGKTLSTDISYNNIDRRSNEYITNDFYTAAGNVYRPPLLLQNLSPSSIDIWAAKVDYVSPISKTSKFEAGLKYGHVESKNYLVFGPLVNGQYQNDPNYSNTFFYTENINSGYINYTSNTDKWNLTAGVRAEQTNATSNSITLMQSFTKHYFDLFPKFQLTLKADEKNQFTLGFTRDIGRPLYTDLNPFLYYIDEYDYRSGNPNLAPEYTNKIQLTHIYKKLLVTSLYASIESGFYGFNDYVQNDATKVDVTIKNNFGIYSVYGINFSAPAHFASWWEAAFAADASYQRIKAYAQYGNLNKGTQDITFTSTQTFHITNTLGFEVFGKYESPNFYGITQIKTIYNVDAGISQQLFNKKGTLKLGISDIFNSARDRGYSDYQNLNLNIVDKVETRIVRLNFTYRFGQIGVRSIKHQTASDEEQKRVGGNN